MRVAIVTHYALRIRDMLGPPQGRAFSAPRKGLASPEVRCGCTVGILSPWAARGMRRFCTRGRVNAATTSLTRAPNSRNSGAAPWAPFFCTKERLAVSGSLAWALLGRPLGAGRPRGGLVLYEGNGCRSNTFFNPRSGFAKFRGRPWAPCLRTKGRLAVFGSSMWALHGSAAHPGPPRGRAGSV